MECVCVRERERERDKERKSVCMCVRGGKKKELSEREIIRNLYTSL